MIIKRQEDLIDAQRELIDQQIARINALVERVNLHTKHITKIEFRYNAYSTLPKEELK